MNLPTNNWNLTISIIDRAISSITGIFQAFQFVATMYYKAVDMYSSYIEHRTRIKSSDNNAIIENINNPKVIESGNEVFSMKNKMIETIVSSNREM